MNQEEVEKFNTTEDAVFSTQQCRAPSLPFKLGEPTQKSADELQLNDIAPRAYHVTRMMDGTSCTVAIHCSVDKEDLDDVFAVVPVEIADDDGVFGCAFTNFYADLHVCTKSMDLKVKLDEGEEPDNVYTKAILPMWPEFRRIIAETGSQFVEDKNVVFVFRGEICGQGVNASSVNKDAVGEPTFHLFETYVLDGKTNEMLTYHDDFFESDTARSRLFAPLNPCERIETVLLMTEENVTDLLNKYRNAPAEDGKGVVLWEMSLAIEACLTGFSFKVKSNEYAQGVDVYECR